MSARCGPIRGAGQDLLETGKTYVMPGNSLDRLSPKEQNALTEYVQLLRERFGYLISTVALFGSVARGESTPDSDIDVLVVVASDDWRLHKQIRYLAADMCLKYEVSLSPRVWSVSHRQEMEDIQSLLYQNIRRDSIDLLELSPSAG
jgi:predicted nucleotidyltransferase